MLKRIIYYLRIFSVVMFIIFIYLLLNIIFNCGVLGISFIVMCILFILINIFTILTRKNIYKELISYNLISLALTFYLGIIVTKLYIGYNEMEAIYSINYDYFKTNFVIIDFVILGIILNTLFIYFYDYKEKHEKTIKKRFKRKAKI